MAALAVGLLISIYLTYVHFHPHALYCSDSGVIDCASVLGSRFGVVGGIPLSIYGVIWFSVAIFLMARDSSIGKVWAVLGVGEVAYSITAMSFIGRICLYCTSVDLIVIAYAGYLLLSA